MMRRFSLLSIAVMLAIAHSPAALGVVILPDPSLVINGTPVASDPQGSPPQLYALGDDFYAYSTDILRQLQGLPSDPLPIGTYGDFGAERNGAGVGGQDLIIYTQAGGQTNSAGLPDPLAAATGATSSFSGTWGGDGSNPATTATVGEVRSFLPAGSNIPVFAFDHNNTGSNPNIAINGYVEILDASDSFARIGLWSFDAIFQPGDGTFQAPADPTNPADPAFVIAPGSLTLGSITGNANTGSGIIDFWGYAPTMNLGDPKFAANDVFRVFVNLAGLDNGGEELFISNTIAPSTAVPEPGSMAVFSLLGLVGSVRALRRRAS